VGNARGIHRLAIRGDGRRDIDARALRTIRDSLRYQLGVANFLYHPIGFDFHQPRVVYIHATGIRGIQIRLTGARWITRNVFSRLVFQEHRVAVDEWWHLLVREQFSRSLWFLLAHEGVVGKFSEFNLQALA
jgi:hypothetical protein